MSKKPGITLDRHDAGFTLGAALVVAGVWWIYPPAGLIAAGVVVLILTLAAASLTKRG